ncbi:MAG: hypothetical protein GYA14_06325 [Ignavibacteria bacterium]|nr:hypothetical protein [Ignavibacteria bacterium]
MKIKSYTRKNFFSTVGKGTIFAMVTSVFPIKILTAKGQNKQKINVQIHPSAVKRNNKV